MAYVTRIAPSPTGFAHLGTFRTAYFNWLAARSSGGKFIVRIDDTDASRNNEDAVRPVYDTLAWLGLDYDQTFRQSERFDHHRDVAQHLVDAGLAERPDDTPLVRFKIKSLNYVPDHFMDTCVGRVEITQTDVDHTDGMVLIKSDGNPAYNFSSIVDDLDTGVNYIIRGTDHISNTPKQLILYSAMGGRPEDVKFAHVGLVNFNKKKLSKRDGAASMLWYKEQGYNPDAVLNFMLRLGWGPKVDDKSTSVLCRKRSLELFLDGGKMRAAPSNLDMNILAAMEKKHRNLSVRKEP